MVADPREKELDERAIQIIEETHVAGRETRHNRAANLHAIHELVQGMPNATFGIKGVDRYSEQEVLDAVCYFTQCSNDINLTMGGGYISPQSTLKALKEAAGKIRAVSSWRGRFVVGTGHPGSLLSYYVKLVDLIQEWGGQVLEAARGARIPPVYELDYFQSVAVISDRASIWHTHDTKPMEAILAEAGVVDLAVVDHGFAGAAINAQIPVITIIDTNDPAPAVAKRRLGADVLVVPMDDNRRLADYLPIVDLIRKYGELTDLRIVEQGDYVA